MSGIDISFCWALADAKPQEGLQFLKQCGFEGIELWPDALDKYGVVEWADGLSATDMKAFQLCPYFNFMEGEDILAASRRQFDRFLVAARMLKCRRLRVFTGPPWGEGVVGAKDATPTQWRNSIDGLREYCDIAAMDGVELCLECHEGSLMENSPSALKLLNAVDRPNLTVNLQLPFDGETWKESVAALGDYTKHIHIHNWIAGLGCGELTNLADGAFDWEPVVRNLVIDRNRHVTLSVEHANHSRGDDPRATALSDGPYLNALRSRILGAHDRGQAMEK